MQASHYLKMGYGDLSRVVFWNIEPLVTLAANLIQWSLPNLNH
jgi:hypothetical protein